MPSYASQTQRFREAGLRAGEAHAAVHAAFRAGLRGGDPAAYEALLVAFRAATKAAMPHDPDRLRQRIDAGQQAALDTAVAFLHADPWFFRSGYYKAWLIRSVKRAELNAMRRAILRDVVLAAVRGRDRREFRAYCQLAAGIASPELQSAIRALTGHTDANVRRRANWVLAVLEQALL